MDRQLASREVGAASLYSGSASGKIRIAPIYAVAIAIVAGDAAGNFHLYAPLWMCLGLVLATIAMMLAGRPRLGSS
ncbi:MAG TPA: hypothetical protein VMT64_10930 [Candidatus Binataceae bacterium]|nr:hypothetical protein [Candidatus Binataceae bacterium]